MLQICIDESGRGNGSVFVLAGFIARVQNWEALADDWHTLLVKSKIKFLKTNQAMSDRFYGWPPSERDKRLVEFARLIRRYVKASLTVLIDYDAFNRVLKFEQRIKGNQWFLKNPYETALWSLMGGAVAFLDGDPTQEKVEFIFDQGMSSPRKLEGIFRDVRKRTERPDLIAKYPHCRDDKEFLPLQAADLFAWHVRKVYEASNVGHVYDTRTWNILDSIERLDFSITEMELRDVRETVVAKQRAKSFI